MDYYYQNDIFEAVEVDSSGLEVIPYPGPETIPLPTTTDVDGWMDCGDDDNANGNGKLPIGAEIPNPSAAARKKQETKELIQKKLAELKRRARKEADKNADQRKVSSVHLSVEKAKDGAAAGSQQNGSSSPSAAVPESEKILNDLFRQFKADKDEKKEQQEMEMSSTLVKINEEIAKLEMQQKRNEGGEDSSDEGLYEESLGGSGHRKKKGKKNKKEKKVKKEKKSRKSKHREDPELEPDFFNVASPKSRKENEDSKVNAESTQEEEGGGNSRKRSCSPSSRAVEGDRTSDRDRTRHKDRDRERRAKDHRERDPDKDRHRHRDHRDYRDRYRESRSSRRSRSRSRDRSHHHHKSEKPFFIDKDKLRRIAIKRVGQMQAAGKSIYATGVTPEDIAQINSGGASINELTAFCRSMAKDSDGSSDEDEILNVPCTAEENDLTGILQPLTRSAAIVMNIRNAKQLPIQTPEDKTKLRSSFPVSSGTHHRKEEPNDWVPVPAPTEKPKKVFEEPGECADDVEDISILIARRLNAVRKLKTNPNDSKMKETIETLDKQTAKWSESKNLPGAFTGRVEARMLTPGELAPNVDKKHQAWVKKDTFLRARPVQGGIGQHILQKMGWNEGQGLGKQNEGSTVPLIVDFNTTRKGLTAPEERSKRAASMADMYNQVSYSNKGGWGGGGGYSAPTVSSSNIIADKHPVSALMEICSRRKWGSPSFVMIHESGPAHKRNFIMQVTVNGTAYQPSIASNNKKQAKTLCTTVALQTMGMIPRDDVPATATPDPLPVAHPSAMDSTEPLPPHLDHFRPPHTLRTVPDIDLSSFR